MPEAPLPEVRIDLFVEELGAERIIYCIENKRVHSLNATANAVFTMCQERMPRGIARARLAEIHGCGLEASEAILSLALADLARAELLAVDHPARSDLSRREVIKKLGVLAASLPVITSILAPRPALAASCLADEADCNATTDGTPCCADPATVCCEHITTGLFGCNFTGQCAP